MCIRDRGQHRNRRAGWRHRAVARSASVHSLWTRAGRAGRSGRCLPGHRHRHRQLLKAVMLALSRIARALSAVAFVAYTAATAEPQTTFSIDPLMVELNATTRNAAMTITN